MAATANDYCKFIEFTESLGFTGGAHEVERLKEWLGLNGHDTKSFESADGRTIDIEDAFGAWADDVKGVVGYDAIRMARKGEDPPKYNTSRNGASAVEIAHVRQTKGARMTTKTIDQHAKEQGWREIKAVKPQDLDNYDDGGFRNWSEFIITLAETSRGKFDDRLEPLTKAQSEGTGAAGGFLVPDQFVASLIMSADELAPHLARRRRFEVNRATVIVPALADRDRSSDETAGVSVPPTGEAATIAEDTINFEQRSVTMQKHGRIVNVSSELMEDEAVGVDSVIRDVFARQIAYQTARDFIEGDGVSAALGILNSGALYSVAKEGGQGADTIVIANLDKMRARIDPTARAPMWLCHLGAYTQLTGFKRGTDHYLWDAVGGVAGEPAAMFNMPLYFTESCSLLGDHGDILLIDPSQYMYFFRSLRVELSHHFKFDSDQWSYRVVLRDNGQPAHNAVRKDDKQYEVASFVSLAERT